MRPGISSLLTLLLLVGALALGAPTWGVAVLAVLFVVTAAIDVLRWRHDRAGSNS